MGGRSWLVIASVWLLASALVACGGGTQVWEAGRIPDALTEIKSAPVPDSVDAELYGQLQAELIRVLQARGVSKATAAPPVGSENVVTDLQATVAGPGAVDLTWTYVNSGDYDQNGEVNIGDLTPVGAFYKAKSTDANWDQASIADGDGNGEVNIGDITPIGAHYGAVTESYVIRSSADPADYPSGPDAANGPGTVNVDTLAFTNSSHNAQGRVVFVYNHPSHQPGAAYWVQPLDRQGGAGARSNKAAVGAGGTVALDVHLASANQPTGGSGTSDQDPYTVERLLFYQLQLFHSIEGDVTSHPGVTYVSSDAAVSVDNAGLMGVGGLANNFTITGTYNGQSATLYFSAFGATAQVTLGLHPATPPFGGTGTVADPYSINAISTYNLQVVDLTQGLDVTGQAAFNNNQPGFVQIDPGGLLVIDPLFIGDFNLSAEFNGNPTLPGMLYFTVQNMAPLASYAYVTGLSGSAPFDIQVDASASYDPNGSIVLYEWDWDSDHVFDFQTTSPQAEHAYESIFSSAPTLRVTDNLGATDTHTNQQTLSVVADRIWSLAQVSPRGLNGCTVRELDGLINIALTGNNYLDFARSTDNLGSGFNNYLDLDHGVSFQSHTAVALDAYEGRIIIGYGAADNSIAPAEPFARFIKSLDSDGTTWPANGVVVKTQVAYSDIEMQPQLDGINIYEVDMTQRLMVYRTDNAGASWPNVNVVEDAFSIRPDFAVGWLERPIAAFAANADGHLVFRRADDIAGTTWSGNAQGVDFSVNARSIGLEVVDGLPAVVYYDCSDIASLSSPIYYCRARNADGTAWEAPLEVANPGWGGYRNVAFTIIRGKPAIAYQQGTSVVVQRALDKQGTRWGVALPCSSSVDARHISFTQVGENAVVAFNMTTDDGATSAGTRCCIQHN